MPHIAVIPGDGIGQEVVPEGLRVLEHLNEAHNLDLTFEQLDFGADRFLRDGTSLPEGFVEQCETSYEAIYLGALGDPRVPDNQHARDILLGLRFQLDLFINLRPIRLLDARYCPLKEKGPEDIDMVVFRENTEGLYTGLGGQFKHGSSDEVAMEVEVNTSKGVRRIIEAAFQYADRHHAPSVCMADKANAMRHGHELWQRAFREIASGYPHIEARHMYVDVLCMEMVRCPEQFDVIVTNNLFGDIITDLGAQLQGGIGLAASGNLHPGKVSLFEPVHGSAPTLVGKNVANPLAAILSAGMMLTHLGHATLEQELQDAVKQCLMDGHVTAELGGSLSTQAVTDALLETLSSPS
jgi:3-isopropylmalate dehydrogenase